MTRYNAAVIGFGRIGRIHAQSIACHTPNVTLKTIADPYLDRPAAEALGATNLLTDVDAVFTDTSLDFVVICTPTDTHVDLIKKAAAAKLDVFCEKPVSHNPEEIDACIVAANQAGIKVQIGFNRRYDPNFSTIKNTITEGKIGDTRIIKVTSRDPEPPGPDYIKRSGGLFNDMTIHDFDMVRFLSGAEAVKVYAEGAVLVDPAIGELGDIDTALITITFKNGTIANIDNCRQSAYGYDQRVEVFGSKGSIQAENNRPNNTLLLSESGSRTEKPLNFFLERYKDAYVAEMKEFVACLDTNTPPRVGLEDVKGALKLAAAAKKSLTTSQPVIMA